MSLINQMYKNIKNLRVNTKGVSLVEIIVVVVLIVILVPSSLGIYIGARKIGGQAYIQHQAAVTLGETNDILRYIRNQGYDLLVNGEFYLIRNPGTNSWLVKSDLPDMDTYERHIDVSNALRHLGSDNLYMPVDTGSSYEDPDTKKIDIEILWSPDYLPLDLASHTLYITNWQDIYTYPPA